MKRMLLVFSLLFSFALSAIASAAGVTPDIFTNKDRKPADIYKDSFIDFNKNGKMDVYENPKAALDDRINDLLSQMSVEEKTVQLATLYGYKRVLQDDLPKPSWKNELWKDGIGNIDEHLNGLAYTPQAATEYSWPPSKHARAINEVQRFFVEDTRLGIPVDFTNEGIRGLCHHGATSFPAQIGQGSMWDRKLVREIGRITGIEAKILGYSNVYAPILDITRDPRWGRVVECYGEDPYLASELGVQMVKGMQEQKIASTGKHFAVYSVPKGGRDGEVRTDPNVTLHEVYEIYNKPFERAVKDADILGFMSSYNDYDATPVTGSHFFLTELLRDQWKFRGYVVSDSWAVGGLKGRHHVADTEKEAVYLAVMAGLNIRTDFTPPSDYVLPLRELIKEGRVPMDIIDSRVRDVLRVKFLVGLFDMPYVTDPDSADKIVHNKDFEKIALESMRKSLVLLKNNGLLPVKMDSVKRILVTGPNGNATGPMIGRYGPNKVNVITIYEGVKALVGDKAIVEYATGCDYFDTNWPENEIIEKPIATKQKKMIERAVAAAENADLVIVAVGDSETTVGESKSRTSLNLPGNQEDLVKALQRTGKPVVAVLINGRPITINWMNRFVPAIIEAWFPNEYAGQVIAEAIFGLYNPGGKLPTTFVKTVGQIPYNFPYKRSSQLDQNMKFSAEGSNTTMISDSLYPFGYGLSYTKFEYSDFVMTPATAGTDANIKVSFKIKNVGPYKGDEVAQLYMSDVTASVVTYEKRLINFERVTLEPGETKSVEFTVTPENLMLYDANLKQVVEPGLFKIMVGSSSEDIRLRGDLTIK